jgi:TerC family integral membrane protein
MRAGETFGSTRPKELPLSTRKAVAWSIVWFALGLAFTGVVAVIAGGEAAGEYVTGFLIEKSLSLDNLFVFAVLFGVLAVPPERRERVLIIGIALAVALRAIFIVAGVALLDAVSWSTYLLGLLLAWTAWHVAKHDDSGEIGNSRLLVALKRRVPPAVLPLAAVAAFDVMFAIDSIPAILAITRDELVVIAANAWSLAGMVSLYFLIEHALAKFRFLNNALAVILAFVAAKLLLADVWHPPILLSLGVVVGTLAVAVLAERLPRKPTDEFAEVARS